VSVYCYIFLIKLAEIRVVISVMISALKRCSVRLNLQLFVEGLVSYLRYFCLLTHSGVQRILCFCFVCLRLVYPILPVSLDCPFFNVYLYQTAIIRSPYVVSKFHFAWSQQPNFLCVLVQYVFYPD